MVHRLEELLNQSAGATPEAVAITERDAAPTSYDALSEAACRIAAHLAQAGVVPGDRIGLMMPKSAGTVAAIFGILQAGAAYVPVDPASPATRAATIFSDCTVKAVLVADALSETLQSAMADAGHPVSADVQTDAFTLLRAMTPGAPVGPDLAYILYTSGSTGRPKGVQHSHTSALAFIDWCSTAFRPEAADRFSSHAPFHFDLSILDIYVPIKHGASVRLIGAEEGKQPGALAELIAAEPITHWYSTPTILRLIAEMGDLASRDHSKLTRVCFAGEVFPTKHLRRLAEYWPHVTWFNLYGPTETNVCTAHRLDDPRTLTGAVPIGVAVSGDTTRVVDIDGSEVDKGSEGELLIAGASVMSGYWGLPERDAEVFVEADGQRWYRTGDVVVEGEDGALVYRGRRDRMVKRRGYRVELGEIEAAMVRHDAISEVAAVAVEPEPGNVGIVLFHDWQGQSGPSLMALKRFANSGLPAYMIPDKFQRLDRLPLTSTDKINYQTLKETARGLLA